MSSDTHSIFGTPFTLDAMEAGLTNRQARYLHRRIRRVRNGPNMMDDIKQIIYGTVGVSGLAGAIVSELISKAYNYVKGGQSQMTEHFPVKKLKTKHDGKRSFANSPSSTNMSKTKDDDVEMDSTLALRSGTSSSAVASNSVKNKETPVDRLNYAIYRPFPSTHQVLMPFHSKGTWNYTATGATSVTALKVRLNSIFDIINSEYGTDYTNVTPASDKVSVGQGIVRPQMREYWKNIYRYYNVIACEYKVTFANLTATPESRQAMIYKYMHGQQDPPRLNNAGTAPIAHAYRQHHPNCEFKALNSIPGWNLGVSPVVEAGTLTPFKYATGGNSYAGPLMDNVNDRRVTFTGVWRPGMIDHEVLEDEFSETWTRFNETPSQFENMTFMIQDSPYGNNVGTAQNGNYFIDMNYIVQLKDLDVKYQYLEAGTDFPAITDFAAQATIASLTAYPSAGSEL